MTLPVKPINEIEEKSEVSINDKILILDSESEEARLASKDELKGDKGDQWDKGDTWEQWPQGIQGIQWPKGDKGDTWAKGDKWDKGDTWNTWPKWDKWDKWDTGAKWDKWDTGATWPQWPTWPQWEQGEQGEQWEQWDKGDKGDKWDKWDKWDTGNGIANVSSEKVWKVTTVTITETDGDDYSFDISDWQDGEWAWDVVWPNSSTDGNVVLFDWATGKLIKDSWKAFTAAWIWALADSTKYGASISVSVDTTDYKITTTLKDQDWNTLGTAQVIDLPLESVVVSGSYDSATKKVILTLENGNTVEFSVADLVSGLQSEITSSNKLDADLVDDSTSTNKFVTSSDKTTWSGKQDALIAWTNIQIAADGKTISATDTKYNAATSSDLWLVKLWSDTVQSVAANAVTGTVNRTYAMQVNSSGQLVVNVPRTNTTYESKTAASWWADVSLVTTWEKYTWNNKQNALTLPATPTQWHLVAWGSDNKSLTDWWAIPTWFNPWWTATTWYVVTKTANWYEWQAPSWWLSVAPNSPITWIKYIWYGTESDYAGLSQYYTDTPWDTEFHTF